MVLFQMSSVRSQFPPMSSGHWILRLCLLEVLEFLLISLQFHLMLLIETFPASSLLRDQFSHECSFLNLGGCGRCS